MDCNEVYKRNSNRFINYLENSERYRQKISSQPNNFLESESFEVKRNWKILDKQFQRDIERLERLLGGMESREKSLAIKWISKLKADPVNFDEALARNNILECLLRFNKFKVFNLRPFNNPALLNSFTEFQAIMPKLSSKKTSVIDLINNSMDNGDFLYKQPVPRDGAFFIVHLAPNLSNSLIPSFSKS